MSDYRKPMQCRKIVRLPYIENFTSKEVKISHLLLSMQLNKLEKKSNIRD